MRKIKERFFIVAALAFLLTLLPVAASAQSYNVSYRNEPITQVLRDLKKRTGYEFVYQKQLLDNVPPITCRCRNMSLNQTLDCILHDNAGLDYEIVGETIVLKPRGANTQMPRQTGERHAVRGVIVDEQGQPLSYATVKIKGSNTGTTTNSDGKFQLFVTAPKVTLEVSYLGFNTQQKTVGAPWEQEYKFVMHEDHKDIDEVVVTGYQVLDKRSLTSAVTSVKAEDILRPDAMSIDQMLEGQIPDLMTFTNSGEAGAAPKIRIRGTSSIIGNREPLWVVDGIVVTDPVQVSVEDLNDPDYVNRIGNAIAGLNPQDIERLDILKDASATAIYGSKAANGVIVITTKRGHVGKPEIRYSNTFNYKLRPRYTDHSIDVMNSQERIQFSRELWKSHYEYNDNISLVGYEGAMLNLINGNITQDEFDAQVKSLETQNTDWFKALLHDSFSQQHTMSINGGTERGSYYASLGLNDNDDVINNTTNKRYTFVLNLDTKFANWLSASFGINANVSKRKYNQESLNPVNFAYTASRCLPAYNADGTYYYYKKAYTRTRSYNYSILNELDNSGVKQDGRSMTFNANFRLRLTDWLTGNLIGSYTTTNTDIDSYWGDRTYWASCLRGAEYGGDIPSDSELPQGGQFTSNNTRNESWTARFQLDWNKYFGDEDVHNFNGTIGVEASSTRYKGYSNTTRGYFPDRGHTFVSDIDPTKYTDYTAWVMANVPSITDDLSRAASAYLAMTYSYHQMVYVNLNGRVDGSNRFGDTSNHSFLPIWSVSSSFNFSQLDFMRDIHWMDYLTLKASYGYQGNMLSNMSPVMLIRKNSMSDFYNEFTANLSQNPNPNLKWEKTHSWNIGLEGSFFNHRLQFEGDVYFKRTKNAFMPKTISTVNGLDTYYINGGNIRNDGYSVAITYSPIMSHDWRWTISTNFSREINEIQSLPSGAQEEYNRLSSFLNGSAIVKGKAIGTFYSYKFLGLSPVDGGPLFDDGQDRWETLVGKSLYDTYTNVLVASGNRYPDMQGGLSTTLRYKQLRFSANFTYSLGGKTRLFEMYNGSGVFDTDNIDPEKTLSRDYLRRWQNPGDELHTNIPAIVTPSSDGYYDYLQHWSRVLSSMGVQQIADNSWTEYNYSDIRVVSADYLKCTNMSITYEFPTKLVSNWHLTRLQLTASASNIFTIADSKLKGQTPTQGGFSTIQLSERPSFSFGLDVTF